LPGIVIVNKHYEADMMLGPALAHLRLQRGEAQSFLQRVQIADVFLATLIPHLDAACSVDAVVGEIVSKQGCVGLPELASHAGLGLRQFERRFADVLGISPKLYARIVRFEAAVRKRTVSSCVSWTAIAHELGYHDQMHMIHDFQLLSGESPTSLAPHLEYLGSVAAQPQRSKMVMKR
jgi:AraC-like DNA-binding protein